MVGDKTLSDPPLMASLMDNFVHKKRLQKTLHKFKDEHGLSKWGKVKKYLSVFGNVLQIFDAAFAVYR